MKKTLLIFITLSVIAALLCLCGCSRTESNTADQTERQTVSGSDFAVSTDIQTATSSDPASVLGQGTDNTAARSDAAVTTQPTSGQTGSLDRWETPQLPAE